VDIPELLELLERHEKRGLPWVTIGTQDLRALIVGYRAPEYEPPKTYNYDNAVCAARPWPFPEANIMEFTRFWRDGKLIP
jgi:flavodoxin